MPLLGVTISDDRHYVSYKANDYDQVREEVNKTNEVSHVNNLLSYVDITVIVGLHVCKSGALTSMYREQAHSLLSLLNSKRRSTRKVLTIWASQVIITHNAHSFNIKAGKK